MLAARCVSARHFGGRCRWAIQWHCGCSRSGTTAANDRCEGVAATGTTPNALPKRMACVAPCVCGGGSAPDLHSSRRSAWGLGRACLEHPQKQGLVGREGVWCAIPLHRISRLELQCDVPWPLAFPNSRNSRMAGFLVFKSCMHTALLGKCASATTSRALWRSLVGRHMTQKEDRHQDFSRFYHSLLLALLWPR